MPVIVLIAVCIISLVYSGGYFDGGMTFMEAFSAAEAGAALAIGGLIGCVFTFVYFWLRGAIGFEKSMESVPQGFIQMIAPILILTFAWTLCSFTRNAMYSADFVSNAMANVGDLRMFLPAIIFIIGAAIGFATGTSWGTIGIMAPIVVSVFNYDAEPILCTIGLAAACSGGVMGDHCSPISDTTIMASAGAHCYHLNHVFTQIPYALTVAGVSFCQLHPGRPDPERVCQPADCCGADGRYSAGHPRYRCQEARRYFPGNGRGRQGSCQVSYTSPKKGKPSIGGFFLRILCRYIAINAGNIG